MSHRWELDGKVAVVTGAGRGIGRAAVLALAQAGADVVLAARSVDQLEEVAAEVQALGRQALVVPTDVADETEVDGLVAATMAEFSRVDVLVNNSGIVASTALLDQSPSEWDAVYAVNVRGTYLVTRAVGRHLVDQGHGKVVNVASNFAFSGVPMHAAYCSSKAAVVAFTRSMAVEWARHGVQVNALAPGYIATDMNAEIRADPELYRRIVRAVPAGRMAEPDELASWLVLLAGPSSDFMTGATIVIDGGQTAR